jgi:DNA-binding NarL/FixJ family response regulator
MLVDDHPIVRERLAELINHESDLVVCGAADARAGA